MKRYAQKAAIDQANMLAVYLSNTQPSNIDLLFIQRHLNDIAAYAEEAKHFSQSTDSQAGSALKDQPRPE